MKGQGEKGRKKVKKGEKGGKGKKKRKNGRNIAKWWGRFSMRPHEGWGRFSKNLKNIHP